MTLKDGRVMVVGGSTNGGGYSSAVDLYDPAAGTWSTGAPMSVGRWGFALLRLQDGRVLAAGGYNGAALAQTEIYDPAANAWTPVGSLRTGRFAGGAAVLPDGRILFAGGYNGSRLTSAEIFDPASGTWSDAAPMTYAHASLVAAALADGRVMLAGGTGDAGAIAAAEIYDPTTNTWSSAGNMTHARYDHGLTLLPDGRMLAAGGSDGFALTNTSDLYDPATNAWTAGPLMNGAHFSKTLQMAGSRAVVFGGADASDAIATVEVYDPAANAWSLGPAMSAARSNAAATLLADGRALVAGGWGTSGVSLASVEFLTMAASSIAAAGVAVSDSQHLTGTLALTSGATGYWDVVLREPGGRAARLVQGFQVLPPAASVSLISVAPSSATKGATLSLAALGTGFDSSVSLRLERPDARLGSWTSAASMSAARGVLKIATLKDGRVIVAGGGTTAGSYSAAADLFDPAAGTWAAASSMSTARQDFIFVTLKDGRVLAAGGYNGAVVAQCEIYDPASNTWTPTGSMRTGRFAGGGALLPDGRVLVAGGYNGARLTSAEIYDPAAGTWSDAAPMTYAHASLMAATLADGRVMLAGGTADGGTAVAAAELYDPATNTWSSAGNMTHGRYDHGMTRLPDGRILAAGGGDGASLTNTSDLYDPVTNSWTAGPLMNGAHFSKTLQMAGTKAVIFGGGDAGGPISTVEVYDPETNAWSLGPSMSAARSNAVATMLADGRALVAGGWGTSESLSSAELLTMPTASITATGVTAADAEHLTGTLNLTGAATGYWDVVVRESAGRAGRLTGGFRVLTPTVVDAIAPVTTLLVDGTAVSTTSLVLVSTDTLGFSAADAGSGVAQTSYALDGGAAGVYASTFTLAIGTHTLVFQSHDNAGNVEGAQTEYITVVATVAASPPHALLTFPSPQAVSVEQTVGGVVAVRGQASSPSLLSWTLSAAPGVDVSTGFAAVAEGAANVSGLLASWNTASLSGAYTLKLTVRDAFGAVAVSTAVVYVGAPAIDLTLGRRDSDVIVSGLKNPQGLVVRPDGLIWVSIDSGHELLLVSSAGVVVQTVDGTHQFQNPRGMSLDAGNNLYVADRDNDRVAKLSPDGSHQLLEFVTGLKRPSDVAVDSDGTVFVADTNNHRVRVFASNGTILRDIVVGGNSQPGGVALSSAGLWVSDLVQNAVFLYTREGTLLKALLGYARVRGGAVDRVQALYVVDRNSDVVNKLDPDGELLLSFGPKSSASAAEQADLLFLSDPVDASLAPDGSLWVADSGHDRLARYVLPSQVHRAPPIASSDHAKDPATRAVDAQDGGKVERNDGTAVRIPPAALPAPLEVTVAPADPAQDATAKQERREAKNIQSVSDEVQYGPEGTQFAAPVTLTISYDPAQVALQGVSEDHLKVHYWNPTLGDWQALDSTVDKTARTVSAHTTHFSVYQVMAPVGVSAADTGFGLKAAYAFPNPATNGSVTLRIQPGQADSVEVHVYDVAGRKVHSSSAFTLTTLDDGNGLGAQLTYDHLWDVSGVGSGVYTYVITARKSGHTDIHKTGRIGVIK